MPTFGSRAGCCARDHLRSGGAVAPFAACRSPSFLRRSGHAGVVRLLLSYQANPSANQCGATALVRAAFAGHAEVCSLLLDAGADPDIADVSFADGRTALHKAAAEGHADVCALLLAHGADPRLVDARGQRAHELAAGQLAASLREACERAVRLNGPGPGAFKVPDLLGPPPPRPDEAGAAAGGSPSALGAAGTASAPVATAVASSPRPRREISLLGLPTRRREARPAAAASSPVAAAAPVGAAGLESAAAQPIAAAPAAPSAPWARVDPHLSALCNTEYAEQPWTSPAATSPASLAARAKQHQVAGAAVAAGAIGSRCAACGGDAVVLSARRCCSALVCPACDREIGRRRASCVCAASVA